MPGVVGPFYNNGGNQDNDRSVLHSGLPLVAEQQQQQQQQQSNGVGFYPTPQSGSYNAYQDSSISHSPLPAQSPASPSYDLKATTTPHNPSISSSSVSKAQPPRPPTATAVTAADSGSQNPFAGPLFDPSDPALFNFDLSSMNFENRYGALEFGMLGHMATGAGDSPSDSATHRGSVSGAGAAFSTTPAGGFGENNSPGNAQPFNVFGTDPLLNDWSSGGRTSQHLNVNDVYPNSSSNGNVGLGAHVAKPDGPPGFAIGTGPGSFASANSVTSPHVPSALEESPFNTATVSSGSDVTATSGLVATNGQKSSVIDAPSGGLKLVTGATSREKRRHRNPSAIYESVKEPYSYTSGFHSLTAFIQHRFPPHKRLQIAKSLASIRPSLIATSKTLNRDDLIFMEKCFQRTLWEYEDFISACGTPTIVLRRTGEVAAVGKEFSILTGWKKEVLLGKEPNLNVNTGGSGPHVGALSRGGMFPSRAAAAEAAAAEGRIQPVFLAELLDDESVVEFYNDFAQLAFGDSRGSVMTTCNLLKYKMQEDTDITTAAADDGPPKNMWSGGISGEASMNRLGFKDGKVECAYSWTVKRDVFDIPMLIVMNVSAFSFEGRHISGLTSSFFGVVSAMYMMTAFGMGWEWDGLVREGCSVFQLRTRLMRTLYCRML